MQSFRVVSGRARIWPWQDGWSPQLFVFFFQIYWLIDCIWLCWVFTAALGLCGLTACRVLISWPGIEPTSPALEGGFLTTGSPGKSLKSPVLITLVFCLYQGFSEDGLQQTLLVGVHTTVRKAILAWNPEWNKNLEVRTWGSGASAWASWWKQITWEVKSMPLRDWGQRGEK